MSVHYDREGSVATLTIARPERRNAVDRETARLLLEAYRRFEADEAARVLVVCGGPEAFCAGADLKALNNDVNAEGGPMGFTRLVSPKPTIAAVEGWCVAGGLEIALWCDIRVAGKTARFGCLERRWGVPLIDGGTQRLWRVVGLGRALDLVLTGRVIEADEAERMGLVNQIVDTGCALRAATDLAAEIAGYPWECVLADRASIYDGIGRSLSDGLRLEAERGHTVREAARAGVARFTSGEGRHGQRRLDE